MTANESAWALAEALQTDLVFRLDLLHDAEAPKLILAAVLMDLALQMAQAEQGAAAEEMVPELHDRLLPTPDRLALSCAAEGPFPLFCRNIQRQDGAFWNKEAPQLVGVSGRKVGRPPPLIWQLRNLPVPQPGERNHLTIGADEVVRLLAF